MFLYLRVKYSLTVVGPLFACWPSVGWKYQNLLMDTWLGCLFGTCGHWGFLGRWFSVVDRKSMIVKRPCSIQGLSVPCSL